MFIKENLIPKLTEELVKPFIPDFKAKPQVEEEIDNDDLKDIDKVADEELETDVVFNKGVDNHFIKRANERGISKQDLIDFFQELGKSKDEFKDEFEDLIDKHKAEKLKEKPSIVAKDEYTGFSIPFVSDDITKMLAATVLAPGMKPKEKKTFSFSEQIVGNSIVCDNCGWTWKIEDGGDDLYVCHKCGHNNTPKETNNFFEPIQNKQLDLNISSEPSRVDYYKDHIQNVIPSDFKVEKNKDKIIVTPTSKMQNLENNPEFKELLVSLTMYMMDHINIEPLPDLIFIEDDTKNAKDLLGKTAHYNPENKSITLYTLNRHPKDILRSYSHEMIHHKQNLEGKLTDIQGQNINEDEYLKELEREAYEYGNGLLFRGWENLIK